MAVRIASSDFILLHCHLGWTERGLAYRTERGLDGFTSHADESAWRRIPDVYCLLHHRGTGEDVPLGNAVRKKERPCISASVFVRIEI